MQQGQAKKTKYYFVKIESKAQTRQEIKSEVTFTGKRIEKGIIDGEEGKGEKLCKTTHSEEKTRDDFR